MKSYKMPNRQSVPNPKIGSPNFSLFLGALVSLGGLCIFAAITAAVIDESRVTAWDVRVLQWLHSINSPFGVKTLVAVSLVGSPVFIGVIGVIMGFLLLRKRQWGLTAVWAIALIGGQILGDVLKLMIRRPRPEFAMLYLNRFTYSLPSGHALLSVIAYGMLAYILVSVWFPGQTAKIAIGLSALLLVSAIGFSRMYLGVHYVSDVIAGFAVGIFWLSSCLSIMNLSRNRSRQKNQ